MAHNKPAKTPLAQTVRDLMAKNGLQPAKLDMPLPPVCITCGVNPSMPGFRRCIACLGKRAQDLALADDGSPLMADAEQDPIAAFVEQEEIFEQAAAAAPTANGTEYLTWLEAENERLSRENVSLTEKLVAMNQKMHEAIGKITCGECGKEIFKRDAREVTSGKGPDAARSWICDHHTMR